MSTPLCLKPQKMTPSLMEQLEREGLIRRLAPGRDDLDAAPGETLGGDLYQPKEGYGPHKLITVTVNRESFAAFGTHPDNEEFWMIGDPDRRPLYLAIARMDRPALEEKLRAGTVTPQDFVLLEMCYNDPQVSFFVMLAGIPHGEAVAPGTGTPPSFYVTESRDLPLDVMDLGEYTLQVDSGSLSSSR